jgi:putative transposase
MSEKGNGDDNAAVETFFKIIKAELIWRHPWETRRQAEMAIFPSCLMNNSALM